MENINFESQRLYYRSLLTEDVNANYLNWLHDSEVNRFLESRFDESDLNSCISYVKNSNLSNGECLLGIFEKNTNRHIGNIKLTAINKVHLTAEIGLMIGEKDTWGKGYASESIRAVCMWANKALGILKVTAGCYEKNIASYKCFIKSGFNLEGFMRAQFWLDGERIGCYRMGLIIDDK